MTEKVSLDPTEVLSLTEIAFQHARSERALAEYFSRPSQHFLDNNTELLSDTLVSEIRQKAILELEHASCMNIMASVEATLRVDYLTRVYEKRRDTLSRKFRDLYRKRGGHARLEDIFKSWTDLPDVPRLIFSEAASAFNYRHWLAHGRYWTKKFGRPYDYLKVRSIAQELVDEIEQYALR